MRRIRCLFRLRQDRAGQAVVEFALIAPILLLIIFGLVDFARAWNAHHAIADTAREAARLVVVWDPNVSMADVQAMVDARLAGARLDPLKAKTTYRCCDPDREITDASPPVTGEPTTVFITYDFDFWLLGALMDLVGNQTVGLKSRITMRTE